MKLMKPCKAESSAFSRKFEIGKGMNVSFSATDAYLILTYLPAGSHIVATASNTTMPPLRVYDGPTQGSLKRTALERNIKALQDILAATSPYRAPPNNSDTRCGGDPLMVIYLPSCYESGTTRS